MVFQYRPQWTIPGAGPSESVLHIESGAVNLQAAVNAIRTFFDSVDPLLPNEVSIIFPSEVSELDTASGELVGVENVEAPAAIIGGGAGAWLGGAGVLVTWNTGAIRDGVRVKGRTFLVPATSAAFFTDGTPLQTTIDTITSAGNVMILSMSSALSGLVVYSRFRPAAAGPPPVTERDGDEFFVTTASVPDRSAILRDRRDD